jgi:transaldolase
VLNILDLRSTFPHFEIWWDSLPWDIPLWREKMEKALGESLPKLIDGDAAMSPLTGVTTNPRLVFNSLSNNPADWLGRFGTMRAKSDFDGYWAAYRQVFKENAAIIQPLWDRREGREGWISAQVPPAAAFSVDEMVALGLDLASVAPNVMVKIPGHQLGIEAIERLVSKGVSLNATLVFTASQVRACLDAIARGLSTPNRPTSARQKIVITFMLGRFGDDAELRSQLAARGHELSQTDIRWLELIAFGIVREMCEASRLPVSLLVSSLKLDTSEEGVSSCFRLERIASTRCIVTLPPQTLERILTIRGLTDRVRRAADVEPPRALVELVHTVPALREMTQADGLNPRDFILRPAFLKAFEEATIGYHRTVDLVQNYREWATAT